MIALAQSRIITPPGVSLPPSVGIILAQSAVAVSCPADVTVDTLATIAIPAGAMGANGRLRVTMLWTMTNSANTKGLACKLGATDFLGVTLTAQVAARIQVEIANRNAQNSQMGFAASQSGFGPTTGANLTGAIDTSAAQNLTITGQKGLAGEVLTLEAYLVELFYKV